MFRKTILVLCFLLLAQAIIAKPKLLVVINDISGTGKASAVFYGQVFSELDEEFEVSIMPRDQRIFGVADLKSYFGIIAVGGDGTVHDIFNALDQQNLLHIPIGHIPAGSGNALARSIFEKHHRKDETYNVKAMVQRIKERSIRPLDLWHYETDRGETGLSFLGFDFGLIADIDMDSESLCGTWLSRHRFEIYGGLYGFFWLRNYRGGLVVPNRPQQPARVIWGMNIPFGSEKVKIAPHAGLNDGLIHVMTLKSDGNWLQEKINAIRFLLNIEQEPYNLPYVSVESHKNIVLDIEEGQRITVDGEPLSLQTTRFQMRHAKKYGHVFSF